MPVSGKKNLQNASSEPWPSKPTPTRGPRLDPYWRLLNRFFEPLVLLFVLGSTRGKHSAFQHQVDTLEGCRRRFLDNLSYICDFTKGGDSTTSIGLEDRPDCFIFWVASNQTSTKIVEFMTAALEGVKSITALSGDKRVSEQQLFIRKCVAFAKPRIIKESKLLSLAIEKCREQLVKDGKPRDLDLSQWLQIFDEKDIFNLCDLAYKHRKSAEMKEIEARSKESKDESSQNITADLHERVRHWVGRLAHHIRAPIQIIEDSSRLQELFAEYSVRQVPTMISTPRPKPDSLTNLSGILNRMLPAKDPMRSEYETALTNLDRKFAISKRVLDQYQNDSQHCVHCEIQVLEYFRKKNLRFANDDHYIGCSKPACFCCHLYIRNHPLPCVEPQTHRKIYLSWGLPILQQGAQDPDFRFQRDMMNKMIEGIRKEALNQIIRVAAGPRWHPDSETGITKSILSEVMRANRPSSLDEDLASLNFAADDPNSDTESTTSELDGSIAGSATSSNAQTIRHVSDLDEKESKGGDDGDDSGDDSDDEGGARL